MNYQELIKPELLVLIPVLNLIGLAIKKSKIADKFIPFILGAIAVILAGAYIFATEQIIGSQSIVMAIFTAITQGILVAGASVYANQLVKQIKEEE